MNLKEYLNKNYSTTATRGYYNIIKSFLNFVYKPHKATYQDIINYIAHLRELGLHPKTIRNHLFAIKIYYRYLLAIGKRKDHPCQYLYLKDQINRTTDLFSLYTTEQLEQFLETYKAGIKNRATQLREKVLISLLIYQGLTVLEISQLKLTDVELEKGTITIKENPKTNGRTLNLKANQIMLMDKYIKLTREQLLQKNPKPCNALILNFSGENILPHDINRLINYGRDKNQKILPIKIRQSVIANLLKSGNDLRIVQVFAGHKRASSTEAYKQNGLDELKTIIDRLHPLQ